MELALFRQVPGSAQRLSARDNGHLEERIGVRQQPAYRSVARLMMGDGALLFRRDNLALAFKTAYDAVYCIQEVLFVDCRFVVTGSTIA